MVLTLYTKAGVGGDPACAGLIRAQPDKGVYCSAL